jgi:4,5-dihydroxyphthalate decarboxylase
MFDAVLRAKDNYWARVKSGAAKGKEDLRYLKLAEIVGDPLPYGLDENLRTLDALIRFAHHQRLIKRAPAVDEAFVDPRL